ncbi:MAG: hypothetical protein JWP00_539 [Chloroflexi bacterium]|nr:hypothetical protein [Chloroflexota bacterium]
MLTKELNKPEIIQRLFARPSNRSGQVFGSLKFDGIMAFLIFWLIGGVHVDGWAHEHIRGLETFFTPWHALFYSGLVAIASFLSITLVGNHLRGYGWTRALPAGYGLSLLGVFIFMLGGFGDMLWHTFLGIEVSVEALLSPSHLALATGGVLIASGPIRAAWLRPQSQGLSLFKLLPMLIAFTMLLSAFTFFTLYGSPFATTWAGANRAVYTRQLQELNVSIGITGLLFQSVLLMGLTLLMVRRWALPFGSLTLLLTVNITLLTFMRDRQLVTGSLALVIVALVTGLAADLFIRQFKPSAAHRRAFRIFAAGVPVLLYGLYFLAIALSGGVWWTTPAWAGAIFLAGIAGLLTSYAVLPPPMPAENGLEPEPK